MDTFMFSFVITMLLMSIAVICVSFGVALITRSEEVRKIAMTLGIFVLGIWMLIFGLKDVYPIIFIPCGIFLLVALGIFIYRELTKKN